jgi:hypothetical protein
MEDEIELALRTIEDEEEWLNEYLNPDKPYIYASEGRVDGPEGYYILRKDMADWCWENIGPYRVKPEWKKQEGDEWGPVSIMVEFKTDVDMMAFALRWM